MVSPAESPTLFPSPPPEPLLGASRPIHIKNMAHPLLFHLRLPQPPPAIPSPLPFFQGTRLKAPPFHRCPISRRLHRSLAFLSHTRDPFPNVPSPLQSPPTSSLIYSRSMKYFLPLSAGNKDMTSELELEWPRKQPDRRVNGVFWIILLNLGIFVADHFFRLPILKSLYLRHARPEWFQFVTATFCHFNWEHLSSNLFFLYIFGKLVEEEEGNLGLWMSYIVTGAGANLVSLLILPSSAVSVGASGAVFGLFAVSVLVKMSWDWRKILEVLILGQFVIERVLEAAQASTGMVGSLGRGSSMVNVNHIAHLSGALIGAALIYIVSRVPSQTSGKDLTSKKKSV